MRILAVVFFILVSIESYSQEFDSIAFKYSNSIKVESIKEHLEIIASDEYEGRETGKKGQKMAMEYLIKEFKLFGIEDYENRGFKQSFPLIEQENVGISIIAANESFILHDNFELSPRILPDTAFENKIVFIGSGKEEAYSSLDVLPKAVFLYVDDTTENWNIRKAISFAKDKGVNAVFYWDENFDENAKKYGHYYLKPRMALKEDLVYKQVTIKTNLSFFESILNQLKFSKSKLDKKGTSKLIGKEIDFAIKIKKPTKELSGENVIAYIPGKEKNEELVVITAHYDHIGVEDSLVFNGADDDGTGTVSLIEIAEAFMEAKKNGHGLKRSILVMPVSGEEKGLLGSRYYTDNPIFPLENTVANLNIDMIGRYDKNHIKDSNYVYLIGSDRLSTDLHKLSEEVNRKYCNFNLDYTFNEENDPNRFYYRSDHYNFAKNNIPVIFYFSGVHEDYHKATDTVEKIDFEKTTRVAKLVFLTAWEIANREERIQLIDTE